MPTLKTKQNLPTWALPITVLVGIIFLVIIAWRVFTGGQIEASASKSVRPMSSDF